MVQQTYRHWAHPWVSRLCAIKYKRNIVQGTVHRIDHSTSTWEAFDKSLRKAKNDWEDNQFSPAFYETIVTDSLLKIKENQDTTTRATTNSIKPERIEKPVILFQNRLIFSRKGCKNVVFLQYSRPANSEPVFIL